ncbi:energy transducer TonB [Dyadobacter sediminis]|uniref:TonB family protein n=1 Tax=Dyadobacter sediminis TaxID=1493691 RepID=A0A5R9KB45_9BACT|nr:energy transducer TonB [Dyadobacter sediminis]TLU91937.1 TonB family protein [Dyadobacter sediminis]GGB98974.1 cell envelope biogenesis protein TonB [Dyadobacter sediminis]
MKRLQENRIDLINKYLQSSKLDPELLPEILDHLACEAEECLWNGKPFEQIYKEITETADAQLLLNLSVDHKNLLAMEKSLNDIVFEGRNKLYGAYDLRKSYGQTIQRSVLMGVTLFLLMVMLPNLYARLVPEPKDSDIAYIVEAKPVDIKIEVPPVPPAAEKPAPAVKMVRSLPPVVLPDNQVEIENIPPTKEELETALPGQENISGIEDLDGIVPPTVPVANDKAIAAEVKPKSDEIFRIVEQAPEYRGGIAAMSAFLQKNLKYPSPAATAGIQGRVFVEFTVGTDGKIENVTAIKGIGFGCDEEAVRVVKLMQNWIPGKQSGAPVRVRFTLPIAFQLN